MKNNIIGFKVMPMLILKSGRIAFKLGREDRDKVSAIRVTDI
jgi:hypothetical protein